jgi:hypothetical protein
MGAWVRVSEWMLMVSTRPAYRPPSAPGNHRLPQSVYWRRRALVVLTSVSLAFFLYLGGTLAFALHNPTYGVSYMARAAEWGRSHGMGSVITWLETEYYKLNPPKKGGKPSLSAFGKGATATQLPTGPLPVPTRMSTPAAHPLPGEGVWHVAGRTTASGIPTVYEAFVRPNAVNTSYVVGVAWMDPRLLQAQLYSGSYIPGGYHFSHSAPITAAASKTLVAAFNAGFRMQDANGGYYTDGRMIIPLRQGAASVVVFKDGTMTVGAWGTKGFTMNNQIASVRQNLRLLVNDSKPVPGLDNPNSIAWGKTLGGTFSVWRSGLGVTKDGAIVYVGGPALSISDLANVLVRAGAVRAMELDINTDWVQYSVFNGQLNTPINGGNGTKLLSGMIGPPSRYFATWWNRDFYTMSLRPTYAGTSTTTTTSKLTPAG